MSFDFKPCSFKKWARLDLWPVKQAVFVLVGLEPPPLPDLLRDGYLDTCYELRWSHLLNGSRDRNHARVLKRALTENKVEELREILRAMDLAILADTVPSQEIFSKTQRVNVVYVKPLDVVSWAREKQFNIPPELDGLFSDAGQLPSPSAIPSKVSDAQVQPESPAWVCTDLPVGESDTSSDTVSDCLTPIITQRILRIVAALEAIGIEPLKVPDGKKLFIKKQLCSEERKLFTESTFEKAWQRAVHDGRVRMEKHAIYSRKQVL